MKTLSIVRTVALTAGLVMFASPSANAAVTNPADNPHRIVVKGDDGNTYVDGQDTLPGYDDEECTYIPGAYYDFANNLVHYADGQSIPWTEWERATGYKEWLAAQAKAVASPSASAASTSGTKSSAATKATAATPTAGAKATPTASAAASQAETIPAEVATSAPATASAAAAQPDVVPTTSTNGDPNLGSEAGFVILGVLAALGALTTGGHEARRRLLRKGQP